MKRYAVMYQLSGLWLTSAVYETRAAAESAMQASVEKWTGNAMMQHIKHKVVEIAGPAPVAIVTM